MNQIARFEIAREPDLSLSTDPERKGFNLLQFSQDSQNITGSPASLLLTPAQANAITVLKEIKPSKSKKAARLYDTLYSRLTELVATGDYVAVEREASAFLAKNPIVPQALRSATEQRIRKFFMLKGASSTKAERIGLYQAIDESDRAIWMRGAHSRIDQEKAQILASVVSGVPLPADADLLGGLKADLAFCILVACAEAQEVCERFSNFANKYLDWAVTLAAYLPEIAFAMEVCKTRETIGEGPVGPAGDRTGTNKMGRVGHRLAQIEAYGKAVATVDQQTAGDTSHETGSENGTARGTPGHTNQCDCSCDDAPCLPIDPCCGEVRWYATELLTLKDKTYCYKPSDIAYIENVAPFETRVRRHGYSRTVVETSETETSSSREETLDHQVTNRFDVQTEMERNQASKLEVDAKLSGKVYGQKYELDTSASLSKDSAYREAREQAREAVEKATLSIQSKTRKQRTRSETVTNTESNKHKFKNTTSCAAISKYFWVTQEKEAQLFSHGPTLMLDMLVPSPAMLFKALEARKRKQGEPAGPPVEPPKPTLRPKEITRDNYEQLVSDFGIVSYDDPPPELPVRYDSGSVSRGSSSASISVPSGYTATQMSITASILHRSFLGFARISAVFGGQMVSNTTKSGWSGPASIGVTGSANITLSEKNASKDSSITVTIKMVPDAIDLGPWQNSIFTSIMAKYEEDLAEYEASLSDYEAALQAYNAKMDDKIQGRHPFACEEIIRTELKRSAIFMMCGQFDWPQVMNMNAQPCGLPWPNRKQADEATNEWYFFDRACNWNQASFTFYDYFRNPMCNWVDSYEPDEGNFLFKSFLRAGYCRVQIPVSAGMEEDVKTYLQTGGIWGQTGTWPTNPTDPRWISVIDEIKHKHDCYQQDREGHAEAYPNPSDGSFDHRIRVTTDRYWDIVSNTADQDAINLDLDRQIFIDGIEYRIIGIGADPSSPVYDPTDASTMTWIMELDRAIELAPYVDPDATDLRIRPHNYAIGARYVGASFRYDLPTDLVWIGDEASPCLPCYPIDCGIECVDIPNKTNGDDDSPSEASGGV